MVDRDAAPRMNADNQRPGWTGRDDAPPFNPNLGYRPIVSVVILSHRPTLLPEAQASYHAQTFPADQREMVVKHGAVYHGNKLNQALQATAGDLIVPCLPDDDRMHPEFLTETVKALDAYPDRDFAYTNIWLFDGPDGDREVPLPAEFNDHTASLQAFPWMTFLIRRTALERVSQEGRSWFQRVFGKRPPLWPYDPKQQYLDWDLGRTMARLGLTGIHVPLPLYQVREHDGNGHKIMNHGAATFAVRNKAVQLGRAQIPLPEFRYPPFYEGRPEVLDGTLIPGLPIVKRSSTDPVEAPHA